jgi:hypothetical protein
MNQKTAGQGNFVNDLLRTEFHRFVDTFSMYSQVHVLTDTVTENLWLNLSRYVHHFTSIRPYVLDAVVISESLYYRLGYPSI